MFHGCSFADMDCQKIAVDLHQVTWGPEYQLSTNITRPNSTDISSVILVSHNPCKRVNLGTLEKK